MDLCMSAQVTAAYTPLAYHRQSTSRVLRERDVKRLRPQLQFQLFEGGQNKTTSGLASVANRRLHSSIQRKKLVTVDMSEIVIFRQLHHCAVPECLVEDSQQEPCDYRLQSGGTLQS